MAGRVVCGVCSTVRMLADERDTRDETHKQ